MRSLAERTARALINSDSEVRRREFEEKRRARMEWIEGGVRALRRLERMWDACDAVEILERILRDEGPEGPEEEMSERFRLALTYIDQMREHRDRMIDEEMRGVESDE